MAKALALIVMLIVSSCTVVEYYIVTKEAAVSNVSHETKQLAQAPVPVTRYELRYTKPPGVSGGNPQVREYCFPATIVQKTEAFFHIEASYRNYNKREVVSLTWDKAVNPDFGTWHQTMPRRSGQWYINNRGLGAWKVEGEDDWIPLRLIKTTTPCPVR